MDPNAAVPGWLTAIFNVSQLLYLGVALIVGIRLLQLARRTGSKPERWLGLQFTLGSGIAYPVLISGVLSASRSVQAGVPVETHASWMVALGFLGLDVAVVFLLLFVRTVFRANDAWAGRLVWAGGLYAAVAYAVLAGSGEFARPTLNSAPYWFHYSATSWVIVWGAFEALRYYALMRRRMKLGLADAVVTNRFLLWGTGSVCGVLIALVAVTPQLLSGPGDPSAPIVASAALTVMSLLGIVAVGLYWLTFFPTQGYLRWVERAQAAS